MSNAILSVTANGTPVYASPQDAPSKTLGQDEFLKLLVAQMTQQDPLSPSSDLSSISDMASFSSVEQLRSSYTELQSMRDSLQTLAGSVLIGHTVQVELDDGSLQSGIVTAVKQSEAGTPQVIVGGHTYDIDQLRTIEQPQPAA